MNKKILAVAIASAVAVPMAAQAVEYKISGHVNRMIRYTDDGQGSDVQHVDNAASRTRFRFKANEDVGNGMKAGIYIETSVASNSSSASTAKGFGTTGSDNGDVKFDIRYSALFFSGNWGKVTLGHTSDAADGTSFADLSNTWLVNEYSSPADHGSSIAFRTTGGGTTGTAMSTGGAFSSFDGGRRDGIRYDTPSLGPVTARVSIHNNSRWSLGAHASTSLGGGELSAAIGYTDFGGTSAANDKWSGSVSYLFSQGTSITGGYGGADRVGGGSDPDSYYVKLGHQWGSNAVSIHYSETRDLSAAGEDNNFWGVGWVYTMRKDIELYAGYNHYELDRAAAEDIDMVLLGSRIKF